MIFLRINGKLLNINAIESFGKNSTSPAINLVFIGGAKEQIGYNSFNEVDAAFKRIEQIISSGLNGIYDLEGDI